MPGWAAIKITKGGIGSVFASVAEVPDGFNRLAYAMLMFPHDGQDVYFIGGNFRNLPGATDFRQQLLTKEELDTLFNYTEPKYDAKNPKAAGYWFLVNPKKVKASANGSSQ